MQQPACSNNQACSVAITYRHGVPAYSNNQACTEAITSRLGVPACSNNQAYPILEIATPFDPWEKLARKIQEKSNKFAVPFLASPSGPNFVAYLHVWSSARSAFSMRNVEKLKGFMTDGYVFKALLDMHRFTSAVLRYPRALHFWCSPLDRTTCCDTESLPTFAPFEIDLRTPFYICMSKSHAAHFEKWAHNF